MPDQSPHMPTPRPLGRRAVTKGAAWSAPVIVAAGAAPIAAATPVPTLVAHGNTTINTTWSSVKARDGRYRYKIYSSANIGSAPPPSQGYCIQNSSPTTKVTNVSVTFWFSSSALTFTRNGMYDPGSWSILARDSSKANKTSSGVTYYAYTSNYQVPYKPSSGTVCLATFAWESAQEQRSDTNYYVSSSATINGTLQTLSSALIPLKIA